MVVTKFPLIHVWWNDGWSMIEYSEYDVMFDDLHGYIMVSLFDKDDHFELIYLDSIWFDNDIDTIFFINPQNLGMRLPFHNGFVQV